MAKSKTVKRPARQPLMMMRGRSLHGPVAGKHKSVPRKSKSAGHYILLNP